MYSLSWKNKLMWLKLCRKSEIVRCVKGSSYSNTSDTFYIGHHYTRTKHTTQLQWSETISDVAFLLLSLFTTSSLHMKLRFSEKATNSWKKTCQNRWHIFLTFCGLSQCGKNSAKNFSGKGMTLIKMQTWDKTTPKMIFIPLCQKLV